MASSVHGPDKLSTTADPAAFHRRLLRAAGASVALTSLVLLTLRYFTALNVAREIEQRLFFDTAQHIADEWRAEPGFPSFESLGRVATKTTRLTPGAQILLLGGSGESIWPPGAPKIIDEQNAVQLLLRQELPSLPRVVVAGDRERAFAVAPVPEARAGSALVVLLPERLWESLRDSNAWLQFVLRLTASSLLEGALLLACFVLLAGQQLKALRALTLTARAYLSGQTDRRYPVLPRDEITEVGIALNSLADDVESLSSRIRRNEAQRRTLLASIAHDLGAPLTALSGFTSLLLRGERRENDERYLLRASESLDRIASMLMNLGDLSRTELGTLRLATAPVDVGEAVNRVVEELRLGADRKNIALTVRHPPGSAIIEADGRLLERIFQNVIGNAIRYTPAGGAVEISIASSEVGVTVSVRDNGIGIPEQQLPFIFEEFVRANAERPDDPGGTGIGLAVVRSLVTLHGGSINVESIVDRGSVFTITLPIGPPAAPLHGAERRVTTGYCRRNAAVSAAGALLALPASCATLAPSAWHPVIGGLTALLASAPVRAFESRSARLLYGGSFSLSALIVSTALARPELLLSGLGIGAFAGLLVNAALSRSLSIAIPARTMAVAVGASAVLGSFFVYDLWNNVGRALIGVRRPLLDGVAAAVAVDLASHRSIERTMLTVGRLAPEWNVLVLDEAGAVTAQSALMDPDVRNVRPLNDDTSQSLAIEVSGARTREVPGAIVDLDRTRLAVLLHTARESSMRGRVYERPTVMLLASEMLLAALVASVLAIIVYRKMSSTMRAAHAVLQEPPTDLQEDDDAIVGLLRQLRNTVSQREAQLRTAVTAKCTLIELVHRSLAGPLEDLRATFSSMRQGGTDRHMQLRHADELAEAMRRLVRELVEYARVSNDSAEVTLEPLNLVDLVDDAYAAYHHAGTSTMITAPPHVPWVMGDVSIVHRIIALLLRVTPAGAEIRSPEIVVEQRCVRVRFHHERCDAADDASAALSRIREELASSYLERLGSQLERTTGGALSFALPLAELS